ncbi:MAG TPA: hypothetical protein VGF27_05330 [Pseudoduganella sp.]
MNFRPYVLATLLVPAIAGAADMDPKAEVFSSLFASLCMKNLHNLEGLRNQLATAQVPKLPAEKAAPFLNGGAGDAWPVPHQGDFGNFVLALPAGKNMCAIFARRARSADVEQMFNSMVSKAPPPLVNEKTIDGRASTVPNGETHTLSYNWFTPNSPRKMTFTLTTAASDSAQLQAMASAALTRE